MRRLFVLTLALLGACAQPQCQAIGLGSVGRGVVGDGAVGSGVVGGRPTAADDPPGFGVDLEMWYDARNPDGSNLPVDLGLRGLGSMTAVDSPSYQASGGPNGGPYWQCRRAGRYRDTDSTDSISSDSNTRAFLLRVDDLVTVAAQDVGNGGASTTPVVRQQSADPAATYRIQANGTCTASVNPGTSWHAVVVITTGTADVVHVKALDSGVKDTSTPGDCATATSGLTERVEWCGSGGNEFDGDISQALYWSAVKDEDEIFDWFDSNF